jgi:hypothetical protein
MPSCEEHRHHFGKKLAVLLGGHVVSTCGWPGLTDEIHTHFGVPASDACCVTTTSRGL